MFVCLFVWLNKTRTVTPLRRFHSWRLSFTNDCLAFSTKTARRTLPSPAKVGIVHKLTGWFGFQATKVPHKTVVSSSTDETDPADEVMKRLFVCLVCLVNKTRTVKPLRRFHSWRLSFTQDGLAFSTKTARRTLQVQLR